MPAYKHLFFDLDHTLWDFDRNSAESITELYHTFRLADRGVATPDDFSGHFVRINRALWDDYDRNLITHGYIRENRFPMVFDALGVDGNDIHVAMNDEYLRLLPRKTHLLESARDVLDYLHGRYPMHIITNGFADIQAIKLESAGIAHYFGEVITNGVVNAKKPDPAIFRYALDLCGAEAADSLMIGDNYEADIMGGKGAGLDTLFYNPGGLPTPVAPTYTISHWTELMAIL
ncbi:YjjG family noncanonical pyrimidine nucleotidase [Spirosoma luteolum]